MPEACGLQPLGIFGGTFDPVHFGHLRLAEEAADRLALAAVRWIPNGRPPLRESPRATAGQRLEMVRLATADNPRFELDSAEVDAERPSFTVPTLERLRLPTVCGARRPLVLIVGADAFSGLPSWHRWECLFDLAHIAVAHRPHVPVDLAQLPPALAEACRGRLCDDPAQLAATPAGRILTFAMTQLDISATRIRNLLSNHGSPRYLLPDALLAYVKNHHLYLDN